MKTNCRTSNNVKIIAIKNDKVQENNQITIEAAKLNEKKAEIIFFSLSLIQN